MPLSSAAVIARASKQLYDETNDQWAFAELLVHLNAGVADVVQLDTKAFMVNAPFQTATGALQNLPGDGIALVDVLYNLDSDGNPERGIRECDFENLKRRRPNWFNSPASVQTRNYCADPNDPKRFYLFPPQPPTPGKIQIVYQGVPDDVVGVQHVNTADAAPNQAVVPMTNTAGIKVGQYVDPAATGGPIVPGTKVLSIQAGVSVTLDTNILQSTIPAETVLTFSDAFPLPDLYAEAVHLFILYQAYQRRSKDGDTQRSSSYYVQYLKNLDQDVKNVTSIQAGRTKQGDTRG